MTSPEALQILAQAADRAPMNGADHRIAGQAVQVLAALIQQVAAANERTAKKAAARNGKPKPSSA